MPCFAAERHWFRKGHVILYLIWKCLINDGDICDRIFPIQVVGEGLHSGVSELTTVL